MRKLSLILLLLLCAPFARGNQAVRGWCEVGAQPVVTSGLTSSTQVQQSFPQCTVTVSIHGGGLATIFSDNNGTPLANPFTATTNGQWQFYAANGHYDVLLTFTGSNPPSPVTYSDVLVSDPANQQAAIPNTLLSFSSTPDFPSTNNASYTLTLTGNVTSSTASGTPANGNLLSLTLIEDATGGRTMTFPSSFNIPLGFSFNTTALATNALTWKFDGTNWNLISNTGSGGGANPGPPANALQKNNGAGALTAAGVIDDGTKLNVNEDLNPLGPNPYVDIRAFGARASNPNVTPAFVGLTATCTATQLTCTISSASTFVNGDGLIIYGAGAAQSMATPAAPTVTPIVALAPVNTLLTTADRGGGATTYNYYVAWRDRAGGMTTLSPVGSTTTGQASLGPQTVNLTSVTRSGQTDSFVTSSAHNMPANAEVFVGSGNSLSDITFYGWYTVASAVDTTHFTVASGPSTALGASASATGGTATWFQGNKVLLPTPPTGAVYGIIYSDRQTAGTCALIGVTNAIGTGSDLEFDDWGQTFTANQAFPANIPTSFSCSSPPAATSDSLSTTIASGAGTTTLTLANAVGTSVSGATIRLDAAPAINAAAAAIHTTGGGSLYIPVDPNGGSFVVNSWVDVSSIAVAQAGNLYLNDTFELACPGGFGCGKWMGDVNPQQGSGSVGSWSNMPTVSVNSAHPGIFFSGQPAATHLSRVTITGVPVNGTLGVLTEAAQNITFDWVPCSPGSGANDFLSSCFMFRTNPSNNDPGNITLDYIGMAPGGGNSPDTGGSNAPTLNCRDCANVTLPHAYMVHRGMFYGSRAGQMQLGVGGVVYINGGGTPLVTTDTPSGLGSGTEVTVGNIVLDTIAHPCIANLGQTSATFDTILAGCVPASSVLPITGTYSLLNGPYLPTFVNSIGSSWGTASDGTVFTGAGGFPYPLNLSNAAIASGTSYPIFINPPPMAAPTCSVSSGGSVAIDAGYKFQLVPEWQNNGFSELSAPSTACPTTTGNQTITINWSAASGNPKDYRIYLTSASHGSGYLAVTGLAGQTSYVWSTASFNGGSFPSVPAGGPTMLMPGTSGVTAPAIVIPDASGFASTLATASLSAARTHTFPNNTGTVAEVNLAQTWTANQSIANGSTIRFLSPNGTNWTALTGPGTNPSSNVTFQLPSSDSSGVQCISSNGSGVLAFSNCSGGTGTPGGSNTQVQYNSSGSFGGSPNFTWLSPALTIGVNASATGQVVLANGGAGGASVTLQNNGATSAYNFNLPTGAGSSGQPLLSGGGGATAQTYGTLGYGGGGTGATTFTANELVFSGASALANLTSSTVNTGNSATQLLLKPGGAAGTALALDTQSTPTGDILDINVNGTKTSWFDSAAILHVPQATYVGSGALSISGSESTCSGALSGTDILCVGDSASHTIQTSLNGGGFKTLPQMINTNPCAHCVALIGTAFPQLNFTSNAGTSGQPLVSQGSSSDPIFTAVGVAGGGTGDTTLTAHGVLVGEGTSPVAVTSAGTTNFPLLGQGSSADPVFAALSLSSAGVTGVLPVANGGTGSSTLSGANIATITGAITPNDCVKWSSSTVITDAGAPCGGGGGSPALSSITAATIANSINNGANTQTWNWTFTGSGLGMKFTENTASTGSGNILAQFTTPSSSTSAPWQGDSNGAGWKINSSGVFAVVGGGALDGSGITASNGFKIPVTAGCTSGADGALCYDSTNKNTHARTNGADSIVGAFASTPATGDLVDTSVASSNTLLHDSGVATANVATATSAASAANQIWESGGANKTLVAADFPQAPIVIPFANCVAGTAGGGPSYASSTWTAACRAGTNNLQGALQAIPSTGAALQFMLELPKDWDTSSQPYINVYYASGANTSGTVIWTASSACVDVSTPGGASDDPAFNAESAFSTQTMANANRMWFIGGQFTAMTSANGCKAQSPVIIKLAVSGTAGSNINAYKAVVTIPRQPVVQAN